MEKNKPAFHLATRLLTVSLLFFALPLIGFGWFLYTSDLKSEKEIAHLQVQVELEIGIDAITAAINTDHQILNRIIRSVDIHSSDELKARAPAGYALFAFEKKGAFWTEASSSTETPMSPLPHQLLECIAAGNSKTNAFKDSLAIADVEGERLMIMTQPLDAFVKKTIKTNSLYPIEFSLRPLLQMTPEHIVYKKSIPGTSLYLTASIPKSAYSQAIHSSFIYKFGWIAVATLCILGAIAMIFYRRLCHPFTRFVAAMDKLGEGDFSIRIPEDGRGFELQDLACIFNTTLEKLETTIAEEKKTRVEKERLSSELEWARQIQKELLPPELPKLNEMEIATHFSPALEVSGDFFDLFHSDGRLILMVIDSAGKGLGPALFSLGLRGALRAQLSKKGDFARKIKEANTLFCMDSKESGMFATAFVAEIDMETFEMSYINAGHLPGLLQHKTSTQHLEKNAPAFGLPWESAEAQKVTFEKESLFCTFSDGLSEQPDPSGEELGSAPIEERLTPSLSAEENCKKILDLHSTHKEGSDRLDDISLLILRRP